MFSSSAFKVSFLTVHITDPFEMIFDERNDVELPFYFILYLENFSGVPNPFIE